MAHKVVLLVLAHHAEALGGLLSLLDGRFRILVHFDAKAGPAPPLPPHASVINARLPIFWGGYNMMRAVRALIDEAYATTPGFRSAVLLTGDTLPLLAPAALEAALLDGGERIDLIEVANDPALRGLSMAEAESRHAIMAWRFQNHTAWDDELLSPKSRAETAAKYAIGPDTADHLRGTAERIATEALGLLPPRPPLFARFYYGASWWALSRQALDLVADDLHGPLHDAFFRFLQVPDEHMIQTILGNKRRGLGACVIGRTPVFVDHTDPERARLGGDALDMAGFRRAADAGYLFARKYRPGRFTDLDAAVAEGRLG